MSNTELKLVAVSEENWHDVAVMEVAEERMEFCASGSYYLCLCHYDGLWQPRLVMRGEEPVGFIMWAEEEESYWLGGLMVDGESGDLDSPILETAMAALEKKGCKSFYISRSPEDKTMAKVLTDLGFKETGEEEEGEIILRRSI